MNKQPAISDLEYRIGKLEQKRDEAKAFENQYRPGTKQFLIYQERVTAIETEIREVAEQIAGMTNPA